MKIKEIQAGQGKIDVEGIITDKGNVREFQKFGKVGRVCNAKLKDDSGSVSITLWNEQIDEVQNGAKVKITNGYAGEWQGDLQLSTGKYGKMEVLSGDVPHIPEEHDEEEV